MPAAQILLDFLVTKRCFVYLFCVWREAEENLQSVCLAVHQPCFSLRFTEPFALCRGGEHRGSQDWEQDGEGPAVPLGNGAG